MPKPVFISGVGHAGRELLLHARRWLLPRLPRTVLLFPSASGQGSASDLRAVAVARELGGQGWRALCVPPQLSLSQRRRLVALENPDVLFFQQTRHPLNDPRLYPGRCSVLDIDDADVLDTRHTHEVVARVVAADAIVAGSRYLAEVFRQHNQDVHVVWTGTYLKPNLASDLRTRPASLVWAPSSAFGYPGELAFVLETVGLLAARRQDFELHIYGVEATRVSEFDALIDPLRRLIEVTAHPLMPYARFVSSMQAHAIGLQPIVMTNPFSRGKSFGKVLAYLVAGVAVIATDELDHGAFFTNGLDGLLMPHDAPRWAEACSQMLDDPELRARIGRDGQHSLEKRLTTQASSIALAAVLGLAADRHDARVG